MELYKSKEGYFFISALLTILMVCSSLWAEEFLHDNIMGLTTVTMLEASKSKKTLLLNIGHLEGYGVDDRVFVVTHSLDGEEKKLIGEARPIKVFPDKSYWYLSRIHAPEELEFLGKGVPLILIEDVRLLAGLHRIKVHRRKVVGLKDQYSYEILRDEEQGIPQHLIQKEEQFSAEPESALVESTVHKDVDVEIIDLHRWRHEGTTRVEVPQERAQGGLFADGQGTGQNLEVEQNQRPLTEIERLEALYIEELQKAPDKAEIVRDFKQEIKESRAKTYTEKKEIVEKTAPPPPERIDFGQKDVQEKKLAEQSLVKKVQKRGRSWSDSMSDEELENFLLRLGDDYEVKRQKRITERVGQKEIFITMAQNMTDNSDPLDQENQRSFKYGVRLGLEYFLDRSSDFFEHWSLETLVRRSLDLYDLGGRNALTDELSIAGSLNWYPFHHPRTTGKTLFFLGVGARWGVMGIRTEQNQLQGGYTLTALPAFQGGFKYRFSSGWGLKALASWSRQNLALNDQEVADELPSTLKVIESRLGVGITYAW